MVELLGEEMNLASDEVLVALRERHAHFGTADHKVAVYQNQALDSAGFGHFVFLIIGPGRTFEMAPVHAPDGDYGPGWKYCHVGFLDLERNQLERNPR